MDPFTLFMIAAGAVKLIGGIISRDAERKREQEKLRMELSELDVQQEAARQQYGTELFANRAQFDVARRQALSQADLALSQARDQYMQSLSQTRLAQLEGNEKIADTAAQLTQEQGHIAATQAASGAKDDITQQVVARESARILQNQQESLERQTNAAKLNARLEYGQQKASVQQKLQEYSAGGVEAQLMSLRQAQLESNFAAQSNIYALRRRNLLSEIGQYNYDFGWFMTDLFSAADVGMQVYSAVR